MHCMQMHFVHARVVAVNHQRFISSVTTSQSLWRAIMLYQQINDLVITGHNWLWNKGYNMLSGSLQLLNTQSGSLLLVLRANSTCPLHAPYFPLLLRIPRRRQLCLPPLYVRREASRKQIPSPPLSITFNHLNPSSGFCSFPPSSTSFSLLLPSSLHWLYLSF